MEAPDAMTELVGTTLEDEGRRERSRDAALGDDGDIDGVTDGDTYRRECDRVLDEDSDSGELGQEVDVEEAGMDLDGTDQEVITESTSFEETADRECDKKKWKVASQKRIGMARKEAQP
jgi:hypothetical protein